MITVPAVGDAQDRNVAAGSSSWKSNAAAPSRHRHAALQLATVVLIVGRLIDYRNRWSPT
jgi:hypothetical protein